MSSWAVGFRAEGSGFRVQGGRGALRGRRICHLVSSPFGSSPRLRDPDAQHLPLREPQTPNPTPCRRGPGRVRAAEPVARTLNHQPSTLQPAGSEQEHPWLLFTAGPMGAGKSFVIKWMSREGHFQLPSIVQIDPDCFRSRLPEWGEYLKRDPATAGAKSHRECGYCVEIAQEVALRASKNVWVDGSLRDSQWYSHVIQDIRARYPHYRIGIIYVYASEATVIARANKREALTGRHVPEGELRNSLEATPRAVKELSPLSDFVAWIANEGEDKTAPKFTKMCDEEACRLLPGDDWEQIRNRFAPIEKLDCAAILVDRAVQESDVVLFTKSYCSYCSQVKDLFRQLQQKVQTFDLDTMERGLEIQVALSGKTGVTTTPQVFVRGDFIGGNSDVFALHERGSLVPKLKSPRKCAISAAAAALLGPF
mmetsp:Transcript_45570/g.114255  ORF Transcript_45570/g.114255 Transcript_45570/m.114255 type:complete len:424 (+) Transcript_45570:573-1844(+)